MPLRTARHDVALIAELLTIAENEARALGDAKPEAEHLLLARGVYRSEVSAREVFQRSRTLARRSPTGLRAAHVLIATIEREHGTAARVVRHLAADRDAVIAKARHLVLQ